MGQYSAGPPPWFSSPYGGSNSYGNGLPQSQSLANAYRYRQDHSPSQDKVLPETDLVMRRLNSGIMGAQQWQALCQLGQETSRPIQYGEYTDLIRPRLNTIGFLKGFEVPNTPSGLSTIAPEQFVQTFGLEPLHPQQILQLMEAVDSVDGKQDGSLTHPQISVEDAMPLVGYFDSGAYGSGQAGRLGQANFDMTITPAERYDAQVGLWQALQSRQLGPLAQSLQQSYRGFYQSE